MPAANTRLPIPEKPQGQEPHVFGRGMRDRLLMTLAVNRRPLYVAELVELLGSDQKKIRKTLAVLVGCGLVVRDRTSMSGRFVALNRAFPAYRELLTFLRALDRRWPQPRVGKPERRAERLVLRNLRLPWNPGPFAGTDLDLVFYSKVRTRTLLAIAATKSSDVTDVRSTFVEDKRSVWNAANHWQREGIVRSRVVGRRRALELNPRYFAYRELRDFLKALRRIADEYDRLADMNLRNPRSPRFVTIK